jgi:hypothetical protein
MHAAINTNVTRQITSGVFFIVIFDFSNYRSSNRWIAVSKFFIGASYSRNRYSDKKNPLVVLSRYSEENFLIGN